MPTPRQIERRKRILGISLDLFTERGYQDTTLDEVAKQARVGKAIIYRYFGNKEALLLAVFDFVLETLDRSLGVYPAEDAEGTLDQRYKAAFTSYLKAFEKNRTLYDFFVKILGSLPHSTWGEQVRQKIFDSFFASLASRHVYLKKSIERGEMRQHDSGLALYMITGAMYAVLIKWYRDGCKPGLAKKAPEIVSFIMDGLRNRE